MTRAVLSATLDPRIAEERDLIEQVSRLAPNRRQEWLRHIIQAASSAIKPPGPNKAEVVAGELVTGPPVRIRIMLDPSIPDENDLFSTYLSLSVKRRGTWLRQCLLAGHAQVVGSAGGGHNPTDASQRAPIIAGDGTPETGRRQVLPPEPPAIRSATSQIAEQKRLPPSTQDSEAAKSLAALKGLFAGGAPV